MYIAISKEVQKRIKAYYGRESQVIYPPVSLSARGPLRSFPPASAPLVFPSEPNAMRAVGNPSSSATPRLKKYFLIVSRLVRFKHIDLAIEAFNKLGWELKVVGTGSDAERLKRMAKGNIEFLGILTDGCLRGYYEGCIALIVPGMEDFGLASLEAQYFGKPVIAFGRGGVLETVIKGKTGEFFYPQKSQSLIDILKTFNAAAYEQKECIKNAQNFSLKEFKKRFMEFVKTV